MSNDDVIVRFNKVSFDFGVEKPILEDASFVIRDGMKITLMGQNGAGKSTLLKLISHELKPEDGSIYLNPNVSVSYAKQVIPREEMSLTLREFFEKCFKEKIYNIDAKIDEVLEVVNLKASYNKVISTFSGGQQSRLLLASALIQNPDLLILDEPTNNLDREGIEHLTGFLMNYPKTCIVVSHDADFLNSFTDGVLYLDVYKHEIKQYVGNYYVVVSEIEAQIEKEKRKNAQYEKEIIANKEKANFFAHKGGKMRLVARRMREKAWEMENSKVRVRREDKAIRDFIIPVEEDLAGELINISYLEIMSGQEQKKIKTNISLKKNQHLLLTGPNGIGKSTLLETLYKGKSKGATIREGVKVGYYRQDFSNLNFEESVFDSLISAMEKPQEETMRSLASGFLLSSKIIYSKIGDLSEGQKGLVAFARLALQEPGILLLDEPTNHINFRHIPVIAKALNLFKGAMILVSHVPDFVEQIRIDEKLDLGE